MKRTSLITAGLAAAALGLLPVSAIASPAALAKKAPQPPVVGH